MEIAAVRTKARRNFPPLPGDLEKTGGHVKAAEVVNSLNRLNFQDGHVFVKLRHVWNNSFITVAARPGPGNVSGVQLSWDEAERFISKDISAYEYCGLFYTDGLKMVWVRAGLRSMGSGGMILTAPEGGDEVSERNCQRLRCLEVSSKLTQGTISLQGTMKDFSATAFSVVLPPEQIAGIKKINIDMPLNLVLYNGEEALLEATCRIVRASTSDLETILVVAPVSTNIRKYKPKQFRSIRQKLTPQPSIEFLHPLLGKKVSLKAIDISGSGASVDEDPVHSLLMPGMIISEMAITFASSLKIYCSGQVLYNRLVRAGDSAQVGLAFTHMDGENQLQLASILHQAKNERTYVGSDVDLNDLWDFFFKTGFVYPRKYLSIEAQKEAIKSLYCRLYSGSPDIARHITYRDKGIIYGHVSMFRYYRATWIMHHHAAIRSSQHKAGLVVMDHILQHINEVHHYADAAMKYIACYFRPNNRFANRAFGGASRSLQDSRKSSLDEFVYFHHTSRGVRKLPDDWVLSRSSLEDFQGLKSYYDEFSGGLMLDCLDLGKGALDEEEINSSYRERGFRRERKFYTLKTGNGRLAAMFILNFSDVGLNMSSLTNCIQVIVIDQKKVGADKIENALSILGDHFEGNASVLLFPRGYADDNALAYENVYTLGILDLKYISKFLGYMKGLTRSPLRLAKK
jgi:hypothetical protein